jgi:dimethylaniline monooxygenase (N-oxide forming)
MTEHDGADIPSGGIAGLAALKNLREIGFDAVGFEQDDHVGGLWAWNARPDRTSVLRGG